MDDDDDFVFSQEAMRQHDDLVFPSYNFGSEPQLQQDQLRLPINGSQHDAGVASGCGPGLGVREGGATEAAHAAPGRRRRELHGKVFSDPIHGTFRLDPLNVAIIDTPQFQRLRELHQLGLTHLVFPGAVHTRFEHSLGTSHLAFDVAERIYRTQGRELGMEMHEIKLVSLAGLCHDLGHGPFSHVFEHEFLRRKVLGEVQGSDACRQLQDWHHESMSTKILEYLVDDNHIEGIEQGDIRRISDFIRGDVEEERGFLFDIVSNKRNGVDVDKIDYLQRDAKMCDVNIGCDFKRLMTLSKVLKEQIGYKWSEYSNIWDLFHARESMHRKVYSHRKTKAVEFMVVDALLEADQALRFSEDIHQPEDFCRLNDSLLNTIENYGLHRRRAAPLDNGAETCLKKAQDIIKRLRRRELYRYGNQFTVPNEFLQDQRWQDMSRKFTAAEVASCYRGGDVALRPDDVIVSQTKIDFTQGGRNPLDRVLFYDNKDDQNGRRIGPHQVVGILPNYHQEIILRVYTPHQDAAYQNAVGEALHAWCTRNFGSNAQMATPARPRQKPMLMPREAAMREADPRRGMVGRPPAPSSATGTVGTSATASRANVTVANGVSDGGRAATVGATGSVAGANRVSSAENDSGTAGGGSGGTPTRSTPFGSGTATESDGGATEMAGRAKRPRSSASLFTEA